MNRARRKNNDFRYIRERGFSRQTAGPAPRGVSFIKLSPGAPPGTKRAVCIYKSKGEWKVWLIPDETTKSPGFANTTLAYTYAAIEGWV